MVATCCLDDVLHAYMDEHPNADKNEIKEILLWLIHCSDCKIHQKRNPDSGWSSSTC